MRDYLDAAIRRGPSKRKIYAAVALTDDQRASIASALRRYWKHADYDCPARLAIYPLHGYESRVIRDGFTDRQYFAWLEAGCSDRATTGCDVVGRPYLSAPFDESMVRCDLIVPIRSDFRGHVWIDDVIPKGLWPERD